MHRTRRDRGEFAPLGSRTTRVAKDVPSRVELHVSTGGQITQTDYFASFLQGCQP